MLACWRDAATRISRSNRGVDSAAASSGERTPTTTLQAEPVLVSDEDPRHPAAAELAFERVAPGQ